MPLLFLGFLFVMLFWLFWAMVWAVALLFWPVTLLVAGVLLWRAQKRRSPRFDAGRATTGPLDGRPGASSRNGAFRNSAFEEHRQETLRRLDEEQGRFREFLDRLRKSRDEQEFAAFMSERSGPPAISQGNAA